ncbi:uncharacterized protein LOC128244465 [Mya arenaria]|nr:uncharacterized protein LOC128244465 [Mya arenaria]
MSWGSSWGHDSWSVREEHGTEGVHCGSCTAGGSSWGGRSWGNGYDERCPGCRRDRAGSPFGSDGMIGHGSSGVMKVLCVTGGYNVAKSVAADSHAASGSHSEDSHSRKKSDADGSHSEDFRSRSGSCTEGFRSRSGSGSEDFRSRSGSCTEGFRSRSGSGTSGRDAKDILLEGFRSRNLAGPVGRGDVCKKQAGMRVSSPLASVAGGTTGTNVRTVSGAVGRGNVSCPSEGVQPRPTTDKAGRGARGSISIFGR